MMDVGGFEVLYGTTMLRSQRYYRVDSSEYSRCTRYTCRPADLRHQAGQDVPSLQRWTHTKAYTGLAIRWTLCLMIYPYSQ